MNMEACLQEHRAVIIGTCRTYLRRWNAQAVLEEQDLIQDAHLYLLAPERRLQIACARNTKALIRKLTRDCCLSVLRRECKRADKLTNLSALEAA